MGGLFNFLKRKKGTVVGIDLSSQMLRAMEIKQSDTKREIVAYAEKRLDAGAIVDGDIMDQDLIIGALEELMQSAKFSTNYVNFAVAGRSVITKVIPLALMERDEVRESIRFEASNHIPFDIDDVTFDFEIINRDEEAGKMDVLLVAAKRDMIDTYISLFNTANLEPKIIDLNAFAIQNAYEYCYIPKEDEVIALVDISIDVATINIIKNTVSKFIRDVGGGGNKFIELLRKDLALSSDQALEVLNGELEAVKNIQTGKFEAAIDSVLTEIAVAIERARSYIGDPRIDKIVVGGEFARVPELDTLLQKRTNIPVEIVDPLKYFEFEDGVLPGDTRKLSPKLLLTIGLALRKVGDNL